MLQSAAATASAPPEDNDLIWSAVTLDWLGQEPVAFHRSFVEVAGGVLPALWLTYILNPERRAMPNTLGPVDGSSAVVELDVPHCTALTGLSREDQHQCWRAAEDLGLLTRWPVEHDEVPHARIDLRRLAHLILEHSRETAEALRQSQQGNGVVLPFDPDALDAKSKRKALERANRLDAGLDASRPSRKASPRARRPTTAIEPR